MALRCTARGLLSVQLRAFQVGTTSAIRVSRVAKQMQGAASAAGFRSQAAARIVASAGEAVEGEEDDPT